MSRKWVLPITLVCLISGFFLSFQLKVLANTNTNPLSQRNTNLVTIINDLEEEITNQELMLEQIRNDLADLESRLLPGDLEILQNSLRDARIVAGLTPVVGQGIIITIDDNNEGLKSNPQDDPNKYIVHYEHLLNLVSELKVGNAEAISVNGQRLITNSEIRCVGNVILINTTRIAPPFVLNAIGSPKHLAEIVNNGELAIMRSTNYPITLVENDQVIIPAYRSDMQFRYTHPVKESE